MNLCPRPQIHVTTPSIRMNRPSVTITTAITDRCCTGRMNTPYVTTPNTKREHQREEEREPVRHAPVDELIAHVRRRHRHLALREVDHLGRAVDEDEGQREAAEDRALREVPRRLLREDVADEAADEQEDGRASEPHEHRPRRRLSLLSAARDRASVAEVAPADGLVLAATPRLARERNPADLEDETRSARAAARCAAFCSTTSTVRPSFSFSSLTIRKISRDEKRRQSERRLVEEQQPRTLP